MAKATVVIPNWNGMEHLPECLRALRDQTFGDFETIVVDNASTDASHAYLEANWPDVRVIRLDSNRGFPGAVNAGIRASDTEYVVLLNNDTKAARDWLEKLIGAMDDHRDFSFGSSKLLRLETPDRIDSAGHAYSLWLGAATNVGEDAEAELFSQRAWVFGVCAAASIYRRTLFDDIGDFDEEFFFTHEDVEFDLRANVAGHRALLVPEAIVFHKRGASHEINPELHLMGVRNRIWVAGKNLPPLALLLWIGGKMLRALWWGPARLVGAGHVAQRSQDSAERSQDPPIGDPSRRARERWRNVTARDTVGAVVGALRALPAKRRSVERARRLSSIELLRGMRSTRTPRPIPVAKR